MTDLCQQGQRDQFLTTLLEPELLPSSPASSCHPEVEPELAAPALEKATPEWHNDTNTNRRVQVHMQNRDGGMWNKANSEKLGMLWEITIKCEWNNWKSNKLVYLEWKIKTNPPSFQGHRGHWRPYPGGRGRGSWSIARPPPLHYFWYTKNLKIK